jgi:membrane protein DedA with SNARE-associated domain
VVNYLIGRFGLVKFFRWLGADLAVNNMKVFMDRRGGALATFLAGAHPNFIGIAMVVNGMARVPMSRALGIGGVAVICWVPAMILVASRLVDQLQESASKAPYVIVAMLLVWAVFGACFDMIRARRKSFGDGESG